MTLIVVSVTFNCTVHVSVHETGVNAILNHVNILQVENSKLLGVYCHEARQARYFMSCPSMSAYKCHCKF